MGSKRNATARLLTFLAESRAAQPWSSQPDALKARCPVALQPQAASRTTGLASICFCQV